jgi:hypothetical protein
MTVVRTLYVAISNEAQELNICEFCTGRGQNVLVIPQASIVFSRAVSIPHLSDKFNVVGICTTENRSRKRTSEQLTIAISVRYMYDVINTSQKT